MDWLEYNDNIYVIRLDMEGDVFQFQADGTMCKQVGFRGYIVDTFKSKLKWFNSNFWYTKTSWGTKYPNKIYFGHKKKRPNESDFLTNKGWDKINAMADEMAIDTDKIIQVILQEVNKKTGKNYIFDESDTSYGMYWFEAYIPVELNGIRHIITWENCD